MSESLTSVEETLQKTHHQVETLSEERLDKVSGIIEESEMSFAETMQDVPSVISHLKQVHITQKAHEEKLLHLLSKLEKYETEVGHEMPINESTLRKLLDQQAAKMDEDMKHLQESCQNIEKPMYITVSYRQFFWFLLGIIVLSAVQGFIKTGNDNNVDGFTVLAAAVTTVLMIILLIFHISQN